MSDIAVPGPKILLIGGTGVGKTHSIRTLIEAGQKVVVIFTEPGMEVLQDITCSDGLHWVYIPPAAPSWDDVLDSVKKINNLSFESLAKLGDVNKRKYDEFVKLIIAMQNFTCDRCKKQFGPVDELGPEWAVVNDSLTGISTMGMNLVVGSKPVKSVADWGVAMDNVERYITKFTTGIRTLAVMTAHAEREVDEVSGSHTIMASTLGRKLAPKIPRFFSDVVLCKREGTKFSWSTAAHGVDLKARNLPLADGIEPSFISIVKAWKTRHG